MDALRNTINTQSIKTKQIVYQNPDGTFPATGAILNITDDKGHTDWTRDPELDTITLVDASGYTGTLSYTYVNNLMVNGVPVGGGGGGDVSGGTNIDVTGPAGNRVVNFDPSGGVNMLGNEITRLSELQFDGSANILFGAVTGLNYGEGTKVLTVNPVSGPMPPALPGQGGQGLTVNGGIRSVVGAMGVQQPITELYGNQLSFFDATGKNSTISLSPVSSNGTLLVTNTTNTPLIGLDAGNGTKITLSSDFSSTNVIEMDTSGNTGTSTILMKDVSNNDFTFIKYTESTKLLKVSGSGGTGFQIDMPLIDASSNSAGTAMQVLTSAGAGNPPYWADVSGGGGSGTVYPGTNISVAGGNTISFDPSGGVDMLLYDISGAGSVSISDGTETVLMDISGTYLRFGSTTGAGVQIATPLFDVSSNTAGTAGQVLTSQGAGLAPYWAAGGGGGGPLQTILYSTPGVIPIGINNATFSSVPPIGTTTVTLEVTLQAGGGGGGGGLGIGSPSVGGIMSSGGGGGGGSGYAQTFTVTLPYDASCNLTVGAGGAGGGGAQILLGSFDAGAGSNGGNTIFDVSGGGSTSVVGGGGGGGGSGTGGLQAGGAGAVAGTAGSFTFSGPGGTGGDDGAGNVFGGAGGDIYGGFGGVSSGGGPGVGGPTSIMAGGQGLGGAAAYSGAGGGGGSGGAGSYGQNGGAGAGGYIQINVMSFT